MVTEVEVEVEAGMMVLIVGLLEEVSESRTTSRAVAEAHLPKLTCHIEDTHTDPATGPVTDYTSSMVQWMRRRQPRYKGGGRMEMERPSPSYIVDVCDSTRGLVLAEIPMA